MTSMRKKRKIKQHHTRHAVIVRRAAKAMAEAFRAQLRTNIRKMGEAFQKHVVEVMEKVQRTVSSPAFQEKMRDILRRTST